MTADRSDPHVTRVPCRRDTEAVIIDAMAEHRLSIEIAAPPDDVFSLWMDLDLMTDWVGGVTRVTDRTGPIDVAGTRYTVWFGPMKSPTEILEVERPHHVRTRFGSVILKGESDVRLEATPSGTRLTQVLRTRGVISAIMARVFAAGSYKGSFQGELEEFRRIAERTGTAVAPAG